ncbi:hypothetical protein L1887_03429 [Cichorium endivia]|nr:hypothetical protein L1887_03429 [Cichorium endivia]
MTMLIAMEQDPDAPPNFWFQPTLTTNRRRTPLVDPVVLIIILPIIALLFLFFFLPPVLYHTSHILKPSSVKSTWDSLNIFLVLFAILCGVLARRNDEVSSSGDVADQANGSVAESSNTAAAEPSGQWVSFSDRKVATGGLRRNSSSYPDFRQESLWENAENRSRFFDDFDVDIYSSPVSRYYSNLSRRMGRESENLYRSTPVSGDIHQRSRRSEADRVGFSEVKEIVVDTFEATPNVSDFREHVPVTPPPPPPPPPPSALSARHSFRSVGRNVKVEIPTKTESDELDKVRSYHPPPPPPPPPPPLPPPPPQTEVWLQRSHHKHKKLERKVSDATKEIATAISSLYNQRKKKNKRKSRNTSSSSDSSPPSVHFIQSPETQEPQQTVPPSPPPPPPPPPPFTFQNLFKKGGKHKKIHSVPATVPPGVPPPPPPPPPSSIFNNLFKSGNKSKRFHSPSTAPQPPQLPPPPSSIMNNLFKNGTKSKRFNPSKPASSPPPPPPPPPPMTPPRYIAPVKSKKVSKRNSQPQPPSPPSPPKLEPRNHRSTSNGKPPLPKPTTYYERDDFLPSGSQSPLIPMPPPPPPFRMPALKFELRGDFVRIRSTHSSVCSSPDRDDVDLSSTTEGGGDSSGPTSGPGPLFFPSPDVNTKADRFISRLKDEWRMEKINSVKDKMG